MAVTVVILLAVNMLVLVTVAAVFSVIELTSTNIKSMRSAWEDTDRRLHLLYGGWLYPVWMCLFLFQFLWLLYGISTLKSRGHSFLLYKELPVMPPSLYVFVTSGTLVILGWFFLFVHDFYYPLSSFCAVFSFVLMGIALAISLHHLKQQKIFMEVNHLEKDIVAVITLVQNGLGVSLTWLLFISLTSALSILRFSHGTPIEDVTSAVLVTLLLYTVIWTVLDMAVGRVMTLWLFSPYISLFIIYLGILIRNLDKTEERNFVVSIIAMTLSFALCIAKMVILLITRMKKNHVTRGSALLQDDGERFRSWRSTQTESSRASLTRQTDAIRQTPTSHVYANTSAEYYNSSFQLRRINLGSMTS